MILLTIIFLGNLSDKRIEAGSFNSVEQHQGLLYTSQYTKAEIRVFRYEQDAYKMQKNFKVPLQKIGNTIPFMDISVRRDRVTYSSTGDNLIYIYSLTGERLMSHNKPSPVSVGELNYTYVSDGDEYGNVLLADRDADQLYVMNERGECRKVQLEPAAEKPRSAVMCNEFLFVASARKKLHKYRCHKTHPEQ